MLRAFLCALDIAQIDGFKLALLRATASSPALSDVAGRRKCRKTATTRPNAFSSQPAPRCRCNRIPTRRLKKPGQPARFSITTNISGRECHLGGPFKPTFGLSGGHELQPLAVPQVRAPVPDVNLESKDFLRRRPVPAPSDLSLSIRIGFP